MSTERLCHKTIMDPRVSLGHQILNSHSTYCNDWITLGGRAAWYDLNFAENYFFTSCVKNVLKNKVTLFCRGHLYAEPE